MKKDNYTCDIYDQNGYAGEVELSGYSAKFIYRPPNLDNVPQEKLDKLKKILDEKG
jgi:hypothetical protein